MTYTLCSHSFVAGCMGNGCLVLKQIVSVRPGRGDCTQVWGVGENDGALLRQGSVTYDRSLRKLFLLSKPRVFLLEASNGAKRAKIDHKSAAA